MKISPVIKGLITVVLMIAIFLLIFYSGKKTDARFQYSVFLVYALGICWTLFAYRQSAAFTGKFGDLFGQGFRCFVVVTLVIAIFYGIFNYLHPELIEEQATLYRKQILESVAKKDRLPTDIEPEIATFKKQFTLRLVSSAIFGYLIIGAGVTAVLSALLTRRTK